jgi:hypothetical protein
MAMEIADELFDIADELEGKRLCCFSDQLCGAGMITKFQSSLK